MTTNQKPTDLISVPTVEGEPILYRPSGELFRYEVDHDTYKPTHQYTSGQPVLEFSEAGETLALYLGSWLIDHFAEFVAKDQAIQAAAEQLANDYASCLDYDDEADTWRGYAGPISSWLGKLLAEQNAEVVRLQWDPSWTVQELSEQVRKAASQSWGKGCAYQYTLGHDHDGVDIKLIKRG